jgi:F-type H+-transporting ATPase subunit a
LENEKPRHWRRWVVLALMIIGFFLTGIFPPISPVISVAPETLFVIQLPWGGTFNFVNTLTTLIVTLVLLFVLAFFTRRSTQKSLKTDLVPRGVGNIMEAVVEMLYNLTEGTASSKWAPVIFTWFATIMIYVVFANMLRLLPGFETIGVLHASEGEGTSIAPIAGNWFMLQPGAGHFEMVPFFRGLSIDLNMTIALAIISVFMTQVIGFRAQRWGYFSKFFNVRTMFKVPFFGVMDFVVGLLELISELAKLLSFSFRLFGVMFAGTVLSIIVATLLGRLSIMPAAIMLFELAMGLIQAFVFGMLTMVFMSQATVGHGHEEEHGEGHPDEAPVHEV